MVRRTTIHPPGWRRDGDATGARRWRQAPAKAAHASILWTVLEFLSRRRRVREVAATARDRIIRLCGRGDGSSASVVHMPATSP